MVQAFKQKFANDPTKNRRHPSLPDCAAAHQYKCPLSYKERSILRKKRVRGIKITADLGPDDDLKVAQTRKRPKHEHAQAAPCEIKDVEPGKRVEREEEGPDQTEADVDKAERHRAAKAARDKAKKDPLVQTKAWCAGVAAYIDKVQRKIKIAKTATFPNNMQHQYTKDFETYLTNLIGTWAILESPTITKKAAKDKMDEANSLVCNVKKDMKAFDQLLNTHR